MALVGRQGLDVLLDVAFGFPVALEHVIWQLIKLDFVCKNVLRHMHGSLESTAGLVEVENRLERRSMTVEKVLLTRRIVVAVRSMGGGRGEKGVRGREGESASGLGVFGG